MIRTIRWFLLFLFVLMTLSVQSGVEAKARPDPEASPKIYGENWAILIGINRYKHASALNYAVADVQAIQKLLVEEFGFRPDRVFTLIDGEATKENIQKLLAGLDRTKVDDRVIVFFAGHGTQIDLPAGGEMGFLVPVDGKISSRSELMTTAIPMQQLRDLAYYIPAKHLLFLVDACYGGLAIAARSLAPGTGQYLSKITAARARQIITAGGKGETVVERPEWGHSAFTYKLLDGLGKELADLNGDRIITSSELAAWLKNQVAAATEGRQLPQFRAFTEDEGDVVFIRPGVPITFRAPTSPRERPESAPASQPANAPPPASASSAASPGEVVKAAYLAANAGNYEEANRYLGSRMFEIVKSETGRYGAKPDWWWDNRMTRHRTIERIEILKEDTKLAETAYVEVRIIYSDGKTREKEHMVIREDGVWKLSSE